MSDSIILCVFSEDNKQYMIVQSESSMHKGPVISIYRKIVQAFPRNYTISDAELQSLQGDKKDEWIWNILNTVQLFM